MTLAIIHSRTHFGLHAPDVTIEVHVSNGLPSLNIVGLPEKAVKESKDRVRCALINNNFHVPSRRIIVNLAPADLPKEGARFDLPIAMGILVATQQLVIEDITRYEFIGELALTGELKPVKGVLPMALMTKKAGRKLVLPSENAQEAALLSGLSIYAVDHLQQMSGHFSGRQPFEIFTATAEIRSIPAYPDLKDVRGQIQAKRALEIAAAGGHSILFRGLPGTGKTMLSSRLPGLLPEMTEDEAQSTAAVYSISGTGFDASRWRYRPFRAPHHSASAVALVGGGNPPRPGEISLANHGVLFLDELPEFNRHVLEALREPMESGIVTISRAARQAQFPSQFQFVAAMNPCPCGYLGDPRCTCTSEQVSRYQQRLSGPLLDRIDMHVTVPPLPPTQLLDQTVSESETSTTVRERVLKAREKQYARAGSVNSQLTGERVTQHCRVDARDLAFLENAFLKLGLSARAYHRILKLSRTIADLDECDWIGRKHLQEALGYRRVIHSVVS